MANALKLLFIRRVTLDAQRGREHELPNRGAEAGEEGVEGLFFLVSKFILAKPAHLLNVSISPSHTLPSLHTIHPSHSNTTSFVSNCRPDPPR